MAMADETAKNRRAIIPVFAETRNAKRTETIWAEWVGEWRMNEWKLKSRAGHRERESSSAFH